MIDKEKIQTVMKYYGDACVEMTDVVRAWERGERPDDAFFRLHDLPVRVFVEPTNRCNKHCVYCASPLHWPWTTSSVPWKAFLPAPICNAPAMVNPCSIRKRRP